MAELLKTTILGFFCEDEGSTPVLQPRTQTNMAAPVITELEIRCALDGLNSHKGAGPDGLFPKVLKALNSHMSPVLGIKTLCTAATFLIVKITRRSKLAVFHPFILKHIFVVF